MKALLYLLLHATLIATILLLYITCPVAQVESSIRNNKRASKVTPHRIDEQADNTLPFEFHSSFWINLHHYLYLQAGLRKRATNSGQTTGSTNSTVAIDQLTVEQQQVWNSALDYYGSKLAGHDFVFDEDLPTINDRLAELEEAQNLNNRGLNN